MRLAVIDTETTGLGPEDQAVELAALIYRAEEYRVGLDTTPEDGPPSETDARPPESYQTHTLLILERVFSTLIRPTVPVQPEARAAHHLTDAQLERAPTMRELAESGNLDWLREVTWVAHNLSFDERLLRQSLTAAQFAWEDFVSESQIDTLQCARHLWPEGRHGNQVMRYRLNLDVRGVERIGPPHRALPDCVVTAALLRECLRHRTVDQLLELTGLPVLQVTCNVGQWRGRPWADVDPGMLRWILQRDFDDDVKHTARHWLGQKNGALR